MTYQQVVDHFGSAATAAEKLGVSRPLMYHWQKHGIPKGRQALIQIQTRGKLRADDPKAAPRG